MSNSLTLGVPDYVQITRQIRFNTMKLSTSWQNSSMSILCLAMQSLLGGGGTPGNPGLDRHWTSASVPCPNNQRCECSIHQSLVGEKCSSDHNKFIIILKSAIKRGSAGCFPTAWGVDNQPLVTVTRFIPFSQVVVYQILNISIKAIQQPEKEVPRYTDSYSNSSILW